MNDSSKVSLSGIMTNRTTKGQTFMSKNRSKTYGNVWGSFYPRLIVHLKHIIYYYHMHTQHISACVLCCVEARGQLYGVWSVFLGSGSQTQVVRFACAFPLWTVLPAQSSPFSLASLNFPAALFGYYIVFCHLHTLLSACAHSPRCFFPWRVER